MGPCVRRGDRCECGCRIGTDFTCQTACHVQTQLRDLTACLARVLPFRSALLQQRAQGMPDARCTRGRVCSKKAHALATTGTPHQPAFPARWCYGLYVISPVTGLFCHRHRRNCSRQLDASVGASGPHDFAVRKPARTSARRLRPPHPALYVRDDRETPLRGDGTEMDIDLIWVWREGKYFWKRGLDRANQIELVQE